MRMFFFYFWASERPRWVGRWIVIYIFSILDLHISSVFTQKHIVLVWVFFSCTQRLF